MANFSPKDYGNIGLGYANWQSMMGMSDKNPFGFTDEDLKPSVPQAAPVAPPVDTTMPKPDYSVPPTQMPSTFGAPPKNTFSLPTLPSLSNKPMSLEDSIRMSFE